MSETLKFKEIDRLLNNTPSPAHANAMTRLKEFKDSMEPFELRIVQAAVRMILGAEAPDINPNFSVFPPMLVKLCKEIRDREIAQRELLRGAIKQISARDEKFHQQPADVRRAAVAAGLARLEDGTRPETIEERDERKAKAKVFLQKHDARFIDQSDDAMRKRLITR